MVISPPPSPVRHRMAAGEAPHEPNGRARSSRTAQSGRPTLHPLRDAEPLTAALRLRRALYLLLVTLLLPGSAQLVAGSRRIGRIALTVWLTVIALVLGLGLLLLVDRRLLITLVTSPLLLALATIACYLAALAWPALLLNTWRLGRPGLLPQRERLGLTGIAAACALVTAMPLVAVGNRTWAAADLISGVFGSGTASDAVDGRYNVLLLGGDAGPDRVGTRPDSMTLASIDVRTGRTVLFSLPRNLENIPFPPGSATAKGLPKGWSCGDKCLLNGIYTWAGEHRSLYPGVADPGAAAMKDAVQGITGLTVNYYVLVDLAGFRDLIDAMGGITVTVGERVPIGGGTSKVSGYIEPGTQHLDGYHALWFARSRHGASDYSRMQRQRCVMNAMVHQLDPAGLLARFQAIAAAGSRVMHTDLPAGELGTFVDLGTKAKTHKITSVQFVPPLVEPGHPDFGLIQERVAAAIKAAGDDPDAPPEHTATTKAQGSAQGSAQGGTTTATTGGAKKSAGATPAKAQTPGGSGSPSPAPPGGTDITTACSA